MTSEVQAMTGVRVIDFSQVLAGPFATQQLAQLGADVIKIEQPGVGDVTRGLMSAGSDGLAPSFLTCNIGKRSLTLDLKAPEAKTIIERLVTDADVVVENFKPGTIERLGFGYEALRAIKPDLIYCSVSGYGQTGPKSPLAAFDGAIQAASGMMSLTGHEATGPTRTGFFAVDMSTAMNAAFAISAALLRRQITGEGQRVDVAMMDTAVMLQAPQMTAYLTEGTVPPLFGNHSPTKQPTANVFRSQDGHVQVIALKERQVQAFLNLIGRGDLYEQYPEPVMRVRATEEIAPVVAAAIAEHPSAHWLEKLAEAGVPAAAVRTLDEVTADTQFEHRPAFTETVRGEQPARVVSASHQTTPAPPRVQRAAPALGEHTSEILSELGYSDADIDQLRADNVV